MTFHWKKKTRRSQGIAQKEKPRLRRIITCYVLRLWCAGVFSFLLIGSAGCGAKSSNPLNDPKKFAEVYTALQIAAAQDSMNAQRADGILRQHGYSRKQFEEAVAHYNAHAEEWAKVLQHTVARLDSVVQAEARSDSATSKSFTPEGKR